jgi:hypothetical protein
MLSRRSILALGAVWLLPRTVAAEKVSNAQLGSVIEIAGAIHLPAALPAGFSKGLAAVRAKLEQDPAAGKAAWKALLEKHKGALRQKDALFAARWLVRESVMEPVAELALAADRARFHEQRRAAVKDHIGALQALQGKSGKVQIRALTLSSAHTKHASAFSVAAHAKDVSHAALAQKIKEWEEKLKTVGDDAQLANVDLQNVLQKQQQTLQMLSSVSKMLHDTALAVIRKIGGG